MSDTDGLEERSEPAEPVATKSVTSSSAWDKALNQQYLRYGGFCERCGEACRPFYKRLPQELIDTACEYNGEHPDCGNHNMVITHNPAETLGNYEIWECQNDNCDYQESY